MTYPKRLPFYDNEQGMELLLQLSRQRGVKAAALLRLLVREEAQRAGLLPAGTTAIGSRRYEAAEPADLKPACSLWEELDASMRRLPDEALATLPTDGAEQHDHYLYGAPKR